jgi:hypothetical protein
VALFSEVVGVPILCNDGSSYCKILTSLTKYLACIGENIVINCHFLLESWSISLIIWNC